MHGVLAWNSSPVVSPAAAPWLSSPAAVAGLLCLLVGLSIIACRRTRLRHLGASMVVILLGALASNANLIPSGTGSEASAVYDGIFDWVAPLSIVWLLLPVRLGQVARAGAPMIFAFGLGVLGTVAGVWVGMALIGGPELLGEDYPAVSGMYAGTYTGGSLNFNAVALHYGVVERGGLYAGLVAADNIITAGWMIACLALPRVLERRWPAKVFGGPPGEADAPAAASPELAASPEPDTDAYDPERFDPADLALALGLGFVVLALSSCLQSFAADAGRALPFLLIVSLVALLGAQVPGLGSLRGARVLAMFSVNLFLVVIGAYCDVGALIELGAIGPRMLVLATTIVGVHGLVCFGGARLARVDVHVASVASQANIGGGSTALAIARSLERDDLVLPGILMGSVGTALGTFLGFWLAGYLGG